MSSCHNGFNAEETKVREERIKDIRGKTRAFLLKVVKNLCIYEGITGKGDLAFKIKRLPIVIQTMREVADELEKESE